MGHVPPFAHFPGGALPVADLDHLLHIASGVSILQRFDDHGRVHQAREDAVGPDVLVGILQGDALREPEDSGFGCGVGHVGNAQTADPCDGRDIADHPAPLFFHDGEHVFTGQEDRFQVDRHDPVPGRFIDLHRTPDGHNPDIVVEDIDPPVGLEALIHHCLHFIGTGHINLHDGTNALFPIDDGFCLLDRGEVDVRGKHFCPLAGKQNRRRFAVSPSGPDRSRSGYDGYPILQPITHRVTSLKGSF